MTPAKERLALALEQALAPAGMVRNARAGMFDDFESESPFPIRDLVNLAELYGLQDIARRAREGEFDATPEEAQAWADRQTDPETVRLLHALRHELPEKARDVAEALDSVRPLRRL